MASTYTNDLRIEEQADGENASTWGQKLNAALEQTAGAFGYGTKALSSDANQTLTMPDGADDGTRSLYLKITSSGSLTATRTVTLGPNTISKVWIIENATTGSQSISIKQGSGAEVTIANGSVKVLYTDGAGAGAAVVDALADVDISGTATLATVDLSGVLKVGSYQAVALKVSGYSSSYRSIMLGAVDNNGGTVSLAVDISSIAGSNFAGQNQAYIGKNGLLFPNNAADNWIGGIARGSSSDNIHVGPATSGGIASGPLTLTSANVGIGTQSPSSLLHLSSASSPTLRIVDTTNSATLLAYAQNDEGILGTYSNHSLGLFTNSTRALTINASQAVTFSGDITVGVSGAGGDATFKGSITVGDAHVIGDDADDNLKITASAGESMHLDTGAYLYLDHGTSSGHGVYLQTGGLTYGSLVDSAGSLFIECQTDDKDIVLRGIDGGTDINMLTLDASEGGDATFSGNVELGDSKELRLGDGDDLKLYHNGSHSYIKDVGTGDLYIAGSGKIELTNADVDETYAIFNDDGSVVLKHDNSTKFSTSASGISVTGEVEITGGVLEVGGSASSYGRIEAYGSSGAYLDLSHATDDSGDYDSRLINDGTNTELTSKAGYIDIHPQAGATYIRHSGTIVFESTAEGFRCRDTSGSDATLSFGSSSNANLAQIVANTSGGEYQFDGYIHGAAFRLRGEDSAEAVHTCMWADPDADVWLYYDGSYKFRTATDGVLVNGSISYASDRRLKKDITPISGALDAVMSLQGVNYTLIDSDTKHIGFIAQDIQSDAPSWLTERVVVEPTSDDATAKRRDLIRDDESVEMLAVNYSNMVALLTEALKEQQIQINELKSEIETLKG